jgi:chaperone BCS1
VSICALILLSMSLFTRFVHSLLFATTNHIERLDPALSRPGRMDVWVNFTHATKFQAEGIFKCFFPSKPPADAATPPPPPVESEDPSQKNLPVPKRKAVTHAVPLLEESEISELAKRFAAAIPEDELSVRHAIVIFFCYIVTQAFCE